MGNDFNGHNYYGELITAKQALELYEDGNYVLSTNSVQGAEGRELIEKLDKFNIDVFLDLDGDDADTVFFVIDRELSQEELIDLMDLVCNHYPDEFSNTKRTTFRMWWD